MSIVITGATGKLGLYLMSEGAALGAQGWARPGVDLLDTSSWLEAWSRQRPSALIHAAALSTVDDCLRDPGLAHRVNAQVAEQLAHRCQLAEVPFVYVSTDMVFDGESAPYGEDAPVAPLSQYGQSKAAGERAVLAHGGWVVRVALLVGPALGQRLSHYDVTLARLRRGERIGAFQDEWRAMVSYRDAARGLLQLAGKMLPENSPRVLHLAGTRRSRYEFSQLLAERLGCASLVEPTSRLDFAAPEPRARDLTLRCEVARRLIDWHPEPLEAQIDSWLA